MHDLWFDISTTIDLSNSYTTIVSMLNLDRRKLLLVSRISLKQCEGFEKLAYIMYPLLQNFIDFYTVDKVIIVIKYYYSLTQHR